MLKLSLVSPFRKILIDEEVEDVLLPGSQGELNILDHHAPLLSSLSMGILKYKPKAETIYKSVVVRWGFCEVLGDKLNILAETAEPVDEIDTKSAEEAYKISEKRLEQAGLGGDELEKLLLEVETNRLRVAAKQVHS